DEAGAGSLRSGCRWWGRRRTVAAAAAALLHEIVRAEVGPHLCDTSGSVERHGVDHSHGHRSYMHAESHSCGVAVRSAHGTVENDPAAGRDRFAIELQDRLAAAL